MLQLARCGRRHQKQKVRCYFASKYNSVSAWNLIKVTLKDRKQDRKANRQTQRFPLSKLISYDLRSTNTHMTRCKPWVAELFSKWRAEVHVKKIMENFCGLNWLLWYHKHLKVAASPPQKKSGGLGPCGLPFRYLCYKLRHSQSCTRREGTN